MCWNYPKEIYLNPNLEYDSIVDDRDGKVYKTIKIGEQTWMAENLNYADSVNTPSLRGNSRCYDDDPKKCEVIGRLYTWMAAIDSVRLARDENLTLVCENNATCDSLSKKLKFTRGICPNGWHLPSSSESHKLFGNEENSRHLISSYAWNQFDFYNKDKTNDSGFSLIPDDRQYALFWNTDDICSGLESMEIWLAGCNFHESNLYCNYSGYGSYYSDRSLYPIRCIKD